MCSQCSTSFGFSSNNHVNVATWEYLRKGVSRNALLPLASITFWQFSKTRKVFVCTWPGSVNRHHASEIHRFSWGSVTGFKLLIQSSMDAQIYSITFSSGERAGQNDKVGTCLSVCWEQPAVRQGALSYMKTTRGCSLQKGITYRSKMCC